MATPMETRGIVRSVYTTTFRAMSTLGPATIIALLIVVAHEYIMLAVGGPRTRLLLPLRWQPAEFVFVALIAPYQVAVYDFARGGPRTPAAHLRANGRRTLTYILVSWLSVAVVALWTWLWNDRERLGLPTSLLLCLVAALWWVRTRLFVIGPVLALTDVPVGLGAAMAATRGQVWVITAAALRVGLVAAVPAIAVAALDMLAYSSATGSNLASALTRSPLSLIVLALTPAMEIEIYHRLGLPLSTPTP